MSRLYTIDEVAKLLRVHPQTVRKWIAAEVLKRGHHWFYAGRQIRIKEGALRDIMHAPPGPT